MLIDKICTALKDIVSKKTQGILSRVLVKNDVSVVTDMKILIEVDNPKLDPQKYPYKEGLMNIDDKSVLLHKDTLTQVEKNIPRKTYIPILANAIICTKKDNNQELNICTTDLTNNQTVVQKIFEEEYPDYLKLYSQEKPVFKIRFSIDVLSKLMKIMSKINKEGMIDLEFYDDEKAVKFESTISGTQRKIKGLIMPCRQS